MWLWVALLLCLTGCSRMSDNAELIDIAGIVSEHPAEALERLGAINRDSLPERDAYYHDFLTLKANDKAYIDHTTDSIILRLLPYYEGEPLYPEVLYYAGRVYSDLGDYPTSLRYFQEALDHIPADKEHLRLKGHICSQTGRLLNTLRMYDSAIPYLKEVLKIDRELNDTFNLAYNNYLLGAIYLRSERLDSAESRINKAYDYSLRLSEVEVADMQLYQAKIQYEKKNLDSALTLVRGLPERVDTLCRNAALINAADIYLAKGISDTAYIYADELIHSSDINNLKNGYRTLLSPGLIDMVPRDSLVEYVTRYSKELNRYYNFNNSQQSIVQESMYNYQLHDRERAKAEHRNERLTVIIVIAAFVILLSVIVILYYRNRRKALLLKLNKSARDLEKLRSFLGINEASDTQIRLPDAGNIDALREYIDEQLRVIEQGNKDDLKLAPLVRHSGVYTTIVDKLNNKDCISDQSEIWGKLEAVVTEAYPLFKERINQLAGTKLKTSEYRMLLLTKCGFSHGNISILMGRTKSTISYRRKQLNNLIFGGEVNLSQFDSIIHCI